MFDTPMMNIMDRHQEILSFLSEKAIQDIFSFGLAKGYLLAAERISYKTLVFSAIVRAGNGHKALEAIAKDLNFLSDQKLLTGSTLYSVHSSPLSGRLLEVDSIAVVALLKVPDHIAPQIECLGLYTWTPEGAYARVLDNLAKPLKEGDFFANIQLSVAAACHLNLNLDDLLNEHIGNFLAVLPPGTEVVSTDQCNIYDLSVPFIILFHNPLMKDFKQVHLEYIRQVVEIDGEPKQFNLIKSVEYIRKDEIDYNSVSDY